MPEWDATGRPIQSAQGTGAQPTGAQQWDANGNPIGVSVQPHPTAQISGRDTRPLLTRLEEIRPTDRNASIGSQALNDLGNVGAGGIGLLHRAARVFTHPTDSLLTDIGGMTPWGAAAEHIATGSSDPERLATQLKGNTRDMGAPLLGQIAAMAMLPHVPEVTEATGQGIKRLGGFVADKTAVGSDVLDRQYGARPGMGVSENRIIAGTKAGLKAKLDAATGARAEAQRSILAGHQGTADISGDVSQPFNDLRAKVTNPRTGVVHPADLRALNEAQTAAVIEQNPATGRPMVYPQNGQPYFKPLNAMTAEEIAEYNSNLRGMTQYGQGETPLADQAIQQAGHNLRTKLAQFAPEAAPATQSLYDTQTASDVVGRNLRGEGGGVVSPTTTLTGLLSSKVAAPALRLGGTAAAAGLDVVGSGVKGAGRLMGKVVGGGATPSSVRPNPAATRPPSAGALPAPQPPLPQGQPLLPQGQVITPPPAPVAGALPGAVQGPMSRVTTRTPTGFGPKVEAPAFSMPVGRLTEKVNPINQVINQLSQHKMGVDMEYVMPEDIQEQLNYGMSVQDIVDNYIENEKEHRRLGGGRR